MVNATVVTVPAKTADCERMRSSTSTLFESGNVVSDSPAPTKSSPSPTTRGQPIASRSTPNHPNRSMIAASVNCDAIKTAVVATIPIRGPAMVIARMMSALIRPPRSIHFGAPNASPTPASD